MKKKSYVYVVKRHDQLYKIGATSDLFRRITILESEQKQYLKIVFFAEFPSRKEAFEMEKKLKEQYRTNRVDGEWYKGPINLKNICEVATIKRTKTIKGKKYLVQESKNQVLEMFKNKYADRGGICKFMEITSKPRSLAEAGRHFGFSRERARQIKEIMTLSN